jgi:hypothetical protein
MVYKQCTYGVLLVHGGGPPQPQAAMTIYEQNGYRNREDYLDSLREDYGEAVDILTSVLPASEDFDGLITSLEDMTDGF